jgi:methylglutamate dehydrogenase subunit A
VLCYGAWIGKHWEMLGKPASIEASYPDGGKQKLDMWTYWRLLEGEVYVDQPYRIARDDRPAGAARRADEHPGGERGPARRFPTTFYVYWKNGAERMERAGVQGGTIPIRIGPKAASTPTAGTTTSTRPTPGSPTT